MSRWKELMQSARGMAHLTAFGVVLLFALPVGAYLAHQQRGVRADIDSNVTRHAALHVHMMEEALERATTATRLLADALPARTPAQLLTIGQSIIKVSGIITRLEVVRSAEAPFIVTRDHAPSANGDGRPVVAAGVRIGLTGNPILAVRAGQLVISQALSTLDENQTARFWGYASTVVPFSNLISAAHLEALVAEGYSIRLLHGQETLNPNAVVFESTFNVNAPWVSRQVGVGGSGHLRLDVQHSAVPFGALSIATWLTFGAGCILLYLLCYRLLRRPVELEFEVRQRTQLLDNEKLAMQREVGYRIRAERLLEHSHRILDSIFEHFPGMIVLKRAGDLRVSRINGSAEDILGRSRESVIGRSAEEIYDPAVADRIVRSDYQAMMDGSVVELPLERIEIPGSAERWVRFRKVVLRDSDGKPEYILEIGEDITDRERLDTQLREHLNFLEQLLDAMPAPIFFKDAEGRYLGANAAFERYLGKKRSEIFGRTVFEISPGSLAYSYHRADCELMAAGGSQIYESRVRGADGEDKDVVFHKAVFHDTSGEAAGIVGMFLDISARKQAEMRITQLNRILSVLSQANQAIVRIHERDELLVEVSRLIKVEGGFPVAWVYLGTSGDGKPPLVLNADDDSRDRAERMTTALLANHRCSPDERLCCETLSCCDAQLAAELGCEGLHTFLHMPLVVQGQCIGGIAILGAERELLNDDERSMLAELADNVAFAIEALAVERRRQAAEGKLQLAARVFENSTEGLIVTDADNRILMVNRAFTHVTGYESEEVIGKTPNILSSGRQSPTFYRQLWQSLSDKGEWRGEIENRRKTGEIYPEWLNISAVRNEAGDLTNYVAVFSDLTARKEIEARVNFLAHYDVLTSLPNRVLFTNRLEQFMAQARVGGGRLAVMFLDIDRFKLVNDSIGHTAGDRLLLEVSTRLLDCVPKGSDVSRLGGDEFAIILSGLDSAAAAASCASSIQHALRQLLRIEEHEIHLSVSIGISVCPDDGDTVEMLASNADAARYAASQAGGNCYRFFEPEMNSRSAERMRLESGLHHALERGELSVFFQPLISSESGDVVGAEALLRWQQLGDGGYVSPATFVPLLEETGLIVPIGEWVMRRACEENKRWRMATGKDLFVAVNLSAVQLADDDIVDRIGGVLRDLDFDTRYLEIELTESAVMRDAQRGIRTMQQLKELGVTLSIDDFGTGYSSLSYLKQLPLDTLKIDRSFVIDAPLEAEAVSIIHAIVALGHSLQLEIIAEGVEHPAQVNFLRETSVDILQGFYFSQPVDSETFLELVTTGKNFTVVAQQPSLQLAAQPPSPRSRRHLRQA